MEDLSTVVDLCTLNQIKLIVHLKCIKTKCKSNSLSLRIKMAPRVRFELTRPYEQQLTIQQPV